MPTQTAYNTIETVSALLAMELVSTDQRRVAWEAIDESDQAVIAVQATAMIDAPIYFGIPALSDQETSWPRLWGRCRGYIDPDPSPAADAPVASIPSRVARAHAIQCAALSLRAVGIDAGRDLEEAANRGVVSQSGGGHAQSIDLERANAAWSKLDTDAQRLLGRYRAASVEVL